MDNTHFEILDLVLVSLDTYLLSRAASHALARGARGRAPIRRRWCIRESRRSPARRRRAYRYIAYKPEAAAAARGRRTVALHWSVLWRAWALQERESAMAGRPEHECFVCKGSLPPLLQCDRTGCTLVRSFKRTPSARQCRCCCWPAAAGVKKGGR